ncbi:MAG: glycosyltransferase family 4 protein [Paracoccus sp. (in: a-proteobacteria)]|nr:glycosyltransferase family 4 protein [Paracoccus sp. (in: a-proteobacteria)]
MSGMNRSHAAEDEHAEFVHNLYAAARHLERAGRLASKMAVIGHILDLRHGAGAGGSDLSDDQDAAFGSSAPRAPQRQILARIAQEVRPGESYELCFHARDLDMLEDRFAFVVPGFFDAAGHDLPAAGNMASSEHAGQYRYLEAEAPASGDYARATARMIVPERAVQMVIQVQRWQGGPDLGRYEVTLKRLDNAAEACAQGHIPVPVAAVPDPAQGVEPPPAGIVRYILSGVIAGGAAPGRPAGLLQLALRDAAGGALVRHLGGRFESTDSMMNTIRLSPRAVDGMIPFRLSVDLPTEAATIIWRLYSAEGQELAPRGDFRLEPLAATAGDIIAALPAGLRADGAGAGDGPARITALRQALPQGPLWQALQAGRYRLLAETVIPTSPNEWIALNCAVDLDDPLAAGARIAVAPYYFDAGGKFLEGASLTGCANMAGGGVLRLASRRDQPAGRLDIRESFVSPEGAVTAAFYVLSQDSDARVAASSAVAAAITADEVHQQIDIPAMDKERLGQAAAIAEQTRDMPVQLAIARAQSSLEPRDARLAQKVRSLSAYLADLDPNWLPSLPSQPRYEPDPQVALHLFKVIYPDESSGGAVRSNSIVEAQANAGLRPVACMPLNSPHAGTGAGNVPADGLEVVRRGGVDVWYPNYPGLDRRQIAPADLLSLETVLWNRAARVSRASLVHAASGFRGYENALKGIAIARANRIPLVYEVRSFHEHTWRPSVAPRMGGRQTLLRMRQEDRCMAMSDAVVTISQAMVANLIGRGVPQERVFFVPNAIDPFFETLADPGRVAALRAAHGIAGKRTIGYISNFSQREGHLVLLNAFSRLAAAGHDDLCLVMVGDGSQREVILAEAARRGLGGRVILPGNVSHDEVRDWYHAIDLFVVPRIADFASDYVTPLKPFEAMSQGIPVIMSDRPVTAEIAGDDRAGVFPAGDDAALAAMIERDLADPSGLRARAARAREWVMRDRVWSSVVRRYDAAYEAARQFHAERQSREGDA